jgi:hypothetical protein
MSLRSIKRFIDDYPAVTALIIATTIGVSICVTCAGLAALALFWFMVHVFPYFID